MAERLYFKLWTTWWTGQSHVDASADALCIGPVLMSFCRWEPGKDEGWAVNENSRPVTTRAIAQRVRWTPARAAAALRELVDLKTVELRGDGAWGLPKFGRWQESASAAKMRRARAKPSDSDVTVTVTGDVTPLGEVEVEDQHASHAGQPPAARRDSKPPDPHAEATTVVLRALNDARSSVTPGLTPLRKREHIRARLADGATVEQLLAVITFAADECRRKPEALRWLDAVTPFRPKNWESRLARAQAWQATSRVSGPRLDLDSTALERKRREAEEFDREHRPWLFESTPERSPEEPA